MDEMPSSEFRKRYATLSKPTRVTVNGHRIGDWVPFGSSALAADLPEGYREVEGPPGGSFSARPFTPAPKPSRR